MAKRKRSEKTYKTAEEMDAYLDSHDVGELVEKYGKYHEPTIRKVNLDLPEWLIKELDLEASRAGVSRQPLIKLWLIQKLDEERRSRVR